jgi:hypothetical protein
MSLTENLVCPEHSLGLAWKFLLYELLLHLVGTTANLIDEDITQWPEIFPT